MNSVYLPCKRVKVNEIYLAHIFTDVYFTHFQFIKKSELFTLNISISVTTFFLDAYYIVLFGVYAYDYIYIHSNIVLCCVYDNKYY